MWWWIIGIVIAICIYSVYYALKHEVPLNETSKNTTLTSRTKPHQGKEPKAMKISSTGDIELPNGMIIQNTSRDRLYKVLCLPARGLVKGIYQCDNEDCEDLCESFYSDKEQLLDAELCPACQRPMIHEVLLNTHSRYCQQITDYGSYTALSYATAKKSIPTLSKIAKSRPDKMKYSLCFQTLVTIAPVVFDSKTIIKIYQLAPSDTTVDIRDRLNASEALKKFYNTLPEAPDWSVTKQSEYTKQDHADLDVFDMSLVFYTWEQQGLIRRKKSGNSYVVQRAANCRGNCI